MSVVLEYERKLWQQGYAYIAGLDEVGRGCLFGDVVAAAVILPKNAVIEGVDDSKKLTPAKREQLFEVIQKEALAIGIGRVDSEMIDRINIKQASRRAMALAVQQLKINPDYLLIDAEKVDSAIPQMSVIKGDSISQSIAAASIVAKVTRDRMCEEWDSQYPGYGIASHKGYATRQHREQILEQGPTVMHRRSFLSNILTIQQELF